MIYPKGLIKNLSAHFTLAEFECPCDSCTTTIVESLLIDKLEKLRAQKGSIIKISKGGGYRCAAYQAKLKLRGYETAIGLSQHQLGLAADISDGVTPGYELRDLALLAGFKAIGVGKLFIHVDCRPDRDRSWTYSY